MIIKLEKLEDLQVFQTTMKNDPSLGMTVTYKGNQFDVEFYVKNGSKDYRHLFDTLINTLCEVNSPREVIELFIGMGFEMSELLDLGFDREFVIDTYEM